MTLFRAFVVALSSLSFWGKCQTQTVLCRETVILNSSTVLTFNSLETVMATAYGCASESVEVMFAQTACYKGYDHDLGIGNRGDCSLSTWDCPTAKFEALGGRYYNISVKTDRFSIAPFSLEMTCEVVTAVAATVTRTANTTIVAETTVTLTTTQTSITSDSATNAGTNGSSPTASHEVRGCMTVTFSGTNLRALVAAFRKTIAKAANVSEERVEVTATPRSICSSLRDSRRLQENQGEHVAMVFVVRCPASMEEAAAQTRNTLATVPPAEVVRILAAEVSQVESLDGQVSVSSGLLTGSVEVAPVNEVTHIAEELGVGLLVALTVAPIMLLCACVFCTLYMAKKKQVLVGGPVRAPDDLLHRNDGEHCMEPATHSACAHEESELQDEEQDSPTVREPSQERQSRADPMVDLGIGDVIFFPENSSGFVVTGHCVMISGEPLPPNIFEEPPDEMEGALCVVPTVESKRGERGLFRSRFILGATSTGEFLALAESAPGSQDEASPCVLDPFPTVRVFKAPAVLRELAQQHGQGALEDLQRFGDWNLFLHVATFLAGALDTVASERFPVCTVVPLAFWRRVVNSESTAAAHQVPLLSAGWQPLAMHPESLARALLQTGFVEALAPVP